MRGLDQVSLRRRAFCHPGQAKREPGAQNGKRIDLLRSRIRLRLSEMTKFGRVCAALFWAFALQAPTIAAGANLIEGGASENSLFIEPSYDGTSVSLFGSVDAGRLDGQPFDIAVTLRGPNQPVTVWKKKRQAGLWVNSESLAFEGAPVYYAVLSTKPVRELAPLQERATHQIGIDALSLALQESQTETGAPEEFRDALIELKKRKSLFIENGYGAIEFFGARLFRAKVFLPPAAGPGLYRAEFFALQNGKVIGRASAQIRLKKIGVEAQLSSAAADRPWLYGLFAVMLATAFGGGASLAFRRI
jgi:uncharacterized protein (TIGR02186 family)